jgi:hypothetical protein
MLQLWHTHTVYPSIKTLQYESYRSHRPHLLQSSTLYLHEVYVVARLINLCIVTVLVSGCSLPHQWHLCALWHHMHRWYRPPSRFHVRQMRHPLSTTLLEVGVSRIPESTSPATPSPSSMGTMIDRTSQHRRSSIPSPWYSPGVGEIQLSPKTRRFPPAIYL